MLGSLAAAALVPIWLATGNEFWRALAFTGFFLNLFNLLPVVPLDGGRAMAAMAPWMWFVGFGAMVAALLPVAEPDPRADPPARRARDLPALEGAQAGVGGQPGLLQGRGRRTALLVGAVYVGLIVALAVGMDVTHLVRTFSDV